MSGTIHGMADTNRHPQAPAEASQTDWSMILRAAGTDEPAGDALEQVARRYWPAIFAFFRASGRDIHEAADLTQGFLCDVVLQRQLLGRADPERGRFRSLLLVSLKNYLAEQFRRAARRKRSDGNPLVRLDPDMLAAAAVDTAPPPDRAFSRQWGKMLIHQVLETVRNECRKDGLELHWTVFEERVAKPMLLGTAPLAYAELVERMGLNDVSQAANMLVTIKRRVARALVEEIRRTVHDEDAVEQEMGELLHDMERVR